MSKDGLEMVERRWSWPGQHGKPVFNLRSEGRSFSNRCLAIADGFYEFTAPEDPKGKAQGPLALLAGGWRLARDCSGDPNIA